MPLRGRETFIVREKQRILCWVLIALFFRNRRTAFDSRFIVMCKIDSLHFHYIVYAKIIPHKGLRTLAA